MVLELAREWRTGAYAKPRAPDRAVREGKENGGVSEIRRGGRASVVEIWRCEREAS